MYHSSTQLTYWTFESEAELAKGREESNLSYRKKYCEINSSQRVDNDTFFLTLNEERQLLRWLEEKLLKDFCCRFNPSIPLNCIGTACHYVKRLYLRYSVMEYSPKLMVLTSIWLACKTEEFNISMDQFVWNIRHLLSEEEATHGKEYARIYGDAILALELILIKELNFHLTIHNSFRAFEGILIDVKTRFHNPSLDDAEVLRKPAKDYLYSTLFTDAILLFTPSQIALTALISAGSKQGINMDAYVTEHLLKDQPEKILQETIKNIKRIRSIARKILKPPSENTARNLELKLEKCRNRETDPLTEEYALLKSVEGEERDRLTNLKWREETQRQKQIEADLLAF